MDSLSFSKFPNLIVNFLVFLLPLIFWPPQNGYELPKVVISEFLIGVLALFVLHSTGLLRKTRAQLRILIGLVFGLTLIDLITKHTVFSFWGNSVRFQGIFLLWILLIFSLIVSLLPYRLPKRPLALCSLVALLLGAILYKNYLGRSISSLGEPNALAASVVFLFPFAYLSNKTVINVKVYKALIIIICLLTIIFSASRSGLIGFVIELIFLTLSRFKLSYLKCFTIVFILYITGLILPFIKPTLYENRVLIWQTSFIAGLKSPLIGNGFGNVQTSIHKESILLNNILKSQTIDSSHNIFLDWWVQGGTLGTVVFLLLIYFPLSKMILSKSRIEMTSFLGILTVLSYNPASVASLVALWYLIGRGFNETQF